MLLNRCDHCSTENPAGNAFCGGCGRALQAETDSSRGAPPEHTGTAEPSRGKRIVVAGIAAATAGLIAVGVLFLMAGRGGDGDEPDPPTESLAEASVCTIHDAAAVGQYRVVDEGQDAGDEASVEAWSRELTDVASFAILDCTVRAYATEAEAAVAYSDEVREIEDSSFSTLLVAGEASPIEAAGLSEDAAAYEARADSGSATHGIYVVMRQGTYVASIHWRESGSELAASDALVLARTVAGRLGADAGGLPPASEAETPEVHLQDPTPTGAVSVPRSDDFVAANESLADKIDALNDAQAALASELNIGHGTSADVERMLRETSAAALDVGRTAEGLAYGIDQMEGDSAKQTAAMYRDLAKMAYIEAFTIGRTDPETVIEPANAAEAVRILGVMWTMLSSGRQDHEDQFEAALAGEYPGDVVRTEIEDDGETFIPSVLIAFAGGREIFTIEDLASYVPEGPVQDEALAIAADPEGGMSAPEMSGIAATRLLLLMDEERLVSTASVQQGSTASISVPARATVAKPKKATVSEQISFCNAWYAQLADVTVLAIQEDFLGRKIVAIIASCEELRERLREANRRQKELAENLALLIDLMTVDYQDPQPPVVTEQNVRLEGTVLTINAVYESYGASSTLSCVAGYAADNGSADAAISQGAGAITLRLQLPPAGTYPEVSYFCSTPYGLVFHGRLTGLAVPTSIVAAPTSPPPPPPEVAPAPTLPPPPPVPTPTTAPECSDDYAIGGLCAR